MNPREKAKKELIGLDREVDLLFNALDSDLPVIIEGDTGTGKTELAKTVSNTLNRPFFRVDGDDSITALKIKGWFSPELVLEIGYSEESFIPGPLTQAMIDGGTFFFNETNRAPSEAVNAVLTALDEQIVTIPRLAPFHAKNGFSAVFTINPREHVATNPLPRAFYDRCVWISLNHLPLDQAMEIVKLRTEIFDEEFLRKVCLIVEKTRKRTEIESGAGVRAAIQISRLLAKIETPTLHDWVDVAIAVLSRKIKLSSGCHEKPEDVIKKIVIEIVASGTEIGSPKKL